MPWNKKSRVLAVFGVGLFACIASVLRLVYSLELLHVPPNTPAYQLDVDRIGLWAYAIYCPIVLLLTLLISAQFCGNSNRHHSRLPASPTPILQAPHLDGSRLIVAIRDPLQRQPNVLAQALPQIYYVGVEQKGYLVLQSQIPQQKEILEVQRRSVH